MPQGKDFAHLFEILQPPPGLLNFKPKDRFSAGGYILVGDLVCNETQTNVMEIHPFPEWVVNSGRFGTCSGKAYAIFARIDPKFLERKISRKDWMGRVQEYKEYLKSLTIDGVFAVELPVGCIIKVCNNVPHYFLSKQQPGEDYPYLVVFEPEIPLLTEDLKIATAYFNLNNILTFPPA